LIPKKLLVINCGTLTYFLDVPKSDLLILKELCGEYWAKHAKFFYLFIFIDFAGAKIRGFDRKTDGRTKLRGTGFCGLGRMRDSPRVGELAALRARDGELAGWLHIRQVYRSRRNNRQTSKKRDQGIESR